jgi:uncharacterized integral membrane protein
MRMLFSLTILLAAFLALLVSGLNPDAVGINLAFVRFTAPLGLMLVVVFVLGLLAGMSWRVRWVAELLGERGRLRRALRLAESRARANAVGADDRPQVTSG